MLKQHRNVPSFRLALFSLGLAGAISLNTISFAATPQLATSLDESAERRITSSVVEALTTIEDHYAGDLDYNRVNESSVDGMLGVLDPHSHFWTREEFLEFRTRQASVYSGVGATIAPHNGKVYIVSPFDNTPAFLAGLRYGDQIIAIDGQPTDGWTSDRVRDNLRGLQGTAVQVTVKRPGVETPITFRVVRNSVNLPSMTNCFMIRPEVGYIGLRREFQSTTGDEVDAALKKLKAQGAKSIILDLRGNPGGLLDEAISVANQFLNRGQKILSYKGRTSSGMFRDYNASNAEPDTSSLVVMVNNGSASASEIVAGAIQDHDRGIIAGENSFGKGLVQTIFQLSNGYGLTLTTAKYYTPSGRLIQRDYSMLSRYEYQKQGILGTGARPNDSKDNQFETDTRRIVKGGFGIEPDVKIPPQLLTAIQVRLLDATFLFGRLLVTGQIPGITEYRVNDLTFGHTLNNSEFVVTDALYQQFLKFVRENSKETGGITTAMVTENEDYIRQQLRREVVTAAYGSEVADEIVIASDTQMVRAIEELPNARLLAEKSRKVWLESSQRTPRRFGQ